MEILRDRINKTLLKEKYCRYFKSVIKAVVDIERQIIALDAELHADLENLLLRNGSRQEDIWGINLYPDRKEEDFIEYSALINIRPSQNNPSMEILDSGIKDRIKQIVEKFISYET